MAYWRAHDAAVEGRELADADLPPMISPPHVRHCIDLLRQRLMCAPDMTVEVKDEAAGGVHGFGVEHGCVDWGQLVDWTVRWQESGSLPSV